MSAPAQLQNAWLAAAEYRDHADELAGQQIWYAVDDQFDVTELEHVEADDSFFVRAQATLNVVWYEDEAEAVEIEGPFDLRLTVAGEFRFGPGREERYIRAWLDYNGAYLLWPYARAYISTISGFGRLPKLTIETRQITEPPEFDPEEDVQSATSPAEH